MVSCVGLMIILMRCFVAFVAGAKQHCSRYFDLRVLDCVSVQLLGFQTGVSLSLSIVVKHQCHQEKGD